MEELIRILIDRLVEKGMAINTIPAFIRDLANTMVANGCSSLRELDNRVRSLGWEDFELDDHTLQLIIAILEPDFIFKPSHWLVWETDHNNLNKGYEKIHMLGLNTKNDRLLQE